VDINLFITRDNEINLNLQLKPNVEKRCINKIK
jgi:hypothetical protein